VSVRWLPYSHCVCQMITIQPLCLSDDYHTTTVSVRWLPYNHCVCQMIICGLSHCFCQVADWRGRGGAHWLPTAFGCWSAQCKSARLVKWTQIACRNSMAADR
jgi:hypothetical protein